MMAATNSAVMPVITLCCLARPAVRRAAPGKLIVLIAWNSLDLPLAVPVAWPAAVRSVAAQSVGVQSAGAAARAPAGHRQGQLELAALAGRAADGHVAAVGAGYRTYQGEPKAGAP